MTIAAAETLEAYADALREAELMCRPIEPLTDALPGLTISDSYAIQEINIRRRLAEGRVLRGRKIGLTSRAMQTLLGVSEPDFGALLDDMFVEDGESVAAHTLIQPKAEAEVAFVLGEDLAGPGVTTIEALRAIEGAAAAIEVVDSRITDWRITIADTIADNASSGRGRQRGRCRRARPSRAVHRMVDKYARAARQRAAGGRRGHVRRLTPRVRCRQR